jgi:hypothetical protein
MKTDPRGRPDVAARNSPSASDASPRRRLPIRLALAIAAIVLVAAIAFRHPLLGAILEQTASAATGDRVSFATFHIGMERSAFADVVVTTSSGDPLVSAKRIDITASLRSVFSDRRRRFALSALTLIEPTLSIVRHADGSYNLGGARGGAGAGGGTVVPWNFDLRIRSGAIRLLDRKPVAPDLAIQRVVALTLDAQVDSDRRTTARGSAAYIGRASAAAPERSWPVRLGADVDEPRGVAIVHLDAPQFPVRGFIGYLQHSSAVRVDAGVLDDVGVRLFALDLDTGRPTDFHVGGRGMLHGGRLTVAALRHPVRDVRGRLLLTDDGVWSRRLTANIAGVRITARGGAFDRLDPTLRIALWSDADLGDVRRLFGFSEHQPVTGGAHVETLLEAPVAQLLIRSQLRIPHGAYGKVPLTDVGGRVDYHAGSVVIDGVRGRYGPAALNVGARFLLGGRALNSAIVAVARAPGRALPYAENLAPEAGVDAVALITGGAAGYAARGSIGLRGSDVGGTGMFDVNERGVGEFGPFTLVRSDGSSLVGTLRLERPTSQSAAWIEARGYRVAVPAQASRLAGLTVPAFPAVAGVIDGDIVGGGQPGAFALAGQLRGGDLRVGEARLGNGTVRLSGTLADVRLDALDLDGPAGRFAGTAAAARGAFALSGSYAGSLERLVPFTGKQDGHGGVSGVVRASVDGNGIVVQSPGAALRGGSVHGVALESTSGTIAVRSGHFALITAAGSIGGRHAVAEGSAGRIAVSAPDIPSEALRETGVPLSTGNVSAYGLADLRGLAPDFAGTVTVAQGRAAGYRVAGDAQIDLAGPHARIDRATGALGATYGSIGGSIDGIGQRSLRYDLDARVPLGDIDLLRRDLNVPVRYLAGTFAAELHVHGSGTRPFVDGRIEAPEGSWNGLAFRDADAHLILDGYGAAARNGTITVGGTRAAVAASIGGGRFAVAAHAAVADLADFNDYFDASDTLGGRGSIDLAFRTYGGRMTSAGDLAMAGVRYRGFTLGDTEAHWGMHSGEIAGTARVRSPSGTLTAALSVAPGPGADIRSALQTARYTGRAALEDLDLGRWIPASGSSLPVLGRVDARVSVAGRFPDVGLALDGTLRDAKIDRFTVRRAHLHARSQGSRIEVLASDADLGFAQLSAKGRLGLAPHDPLAFDLQVATGDVAGAAQTFVPVLRGLDLAGALDADIRVGGTRAHPTVAGGFDLRDARYGTFVVPRAIGEVALSGRAIELRNADVEFVRGQAFVAGSLPFVFEPFGLGPARAPLSFDVTARSVDLGQFAPLLPAGTKLGGTLDGRFGVEGTVDRPRLLGAVAVIDAAYASPFERAPIEHIGANVRLAGRSIAVEGFHADVGGGTLDGSGRLTLPFGDRSGISYRAGLTAKSARLDFPAYGRGTIDGELQLDGSGARPLVLGTIALSNAVVPVSAVYGNGPAASAASGSALAFDPSFRIHAVAENGVRVRSSIVDIGVNGAVDLTGSLHAPLLAGGFTATDGTISSYNHVFRLVNAAVTFNPADGPVPTIEARAMSRVRNPDPDPNRNVAGSATIIVTVSGTADSNNLQVTYSSEPAYSQEQIVGLLLDVPALLGAVNFSLNGGPGAPLLRGAPGETNALLPPGVTPEQESAISFNEEVFSLLNGQLTQRALSPIERDVERFLGLSDAELTVDYGGGIGYALRRQIGKRDLYAFVSQTVSYPERSNVGFEYVPKPNESLNFSYYQQNGVTSLITNATPGEYFYNSTRGYTSVQPLGNRSGVSLTLSRRF